MRRSERCRIFPPLAGKGKELKQVDHAKMNYLEFRKNFYIESPEIAQMTEEEVKAYREKELEGVKLRGKGCPNPIKKWIHCGLSSKMYKVLEREGLTNPFPIQAQAIPAIMSGRDVIACAKTVRSSFVSVCILACVWGGGELPRDYWVYICKSQYYVVC